MRTVSEALDETGRIISALRAELKESHLHTDRLREERDDARIKLRELQSGKVDVAGIVTFFMLEFHIEMSQPAFEKLCNNAILRSHLEGKS